MVLILTKAGLWQMFLANNIADILSDWPTAVNIVIGF